MANMQRSADLLLEESRRRLQEEAEAVQREVRERELQEERELRKLRATARDTPMNDALSEFEEKVCMPLPLFYLIVSKVEVLEIACHVY